MGVKEAALSHSERFGVDFGEVGQTDWCQCKSSEQNRASKHQTCSSGLRGQYTSLTGRQAGGEAKGLEEALIMG